MRPLIAAMALAAVLTSTTSHAGFTPEIARALDTATYVYVQSERTSGAWSTPAEIWFFVDQGTIVVGTRPTSWRVRRIRAGRAKARIAVGKTDGPAFEATGALVNDRDLQRRLMEAFAKKYPEGWARYENQFRAGFETGERVLVRYTPR